MRRCFAKLAVPTGLGIFAPHVLLAAQASCSDTTDPLACRLGEFLSWLHFAAATLGIVLVVVLVVAFRILHRKRHPDDPHARRDPSRKTPSAPQEPRR